MGRNQRSINCLPSLPQWVIVTHVSRHFKAEGRRCCCQNTLHISWFELDGGICWRVTMAHPLNNYTGLQLGISVCRACQGTWYLLLISVSLAPSWEKGKSRVERKGTCGGREGGAFSSTRCCLKLCPGVKVIFGKQQWINAVRISKERRPLNLLFLNDLICWGGSRSDVDNSYLSLFLKENIRLGTKWYLRRPQSSNFGDSILVLFTRCEKLGESWQSTRWRIRNQIGSGSATAVFAWHK